VTVADPTAPPIALSLKQPWLFAILSLGKEIENRTWRSSRRGRVILHASKIFDDAGLRYLVEAGFHVPDELPMGAYVGEVTITDCLPVTACTSPWAFGPWCYTLERPLAYPEPIPGRGQLGFYPVPEEVARIVAVMTETRQTFSATSCILQYDEP
jgi:ASCH domain